MKSSSFIYIKISCVLLLIALSNTRSAEAQFGAMFSAAGPVNRSMAGTSMADPLSPGGALLWNPAALATLDRSQLEFGAEILLPATTLSSTIPADSLGPGFPATTLSGLSETEPAAFALPTIALSYSPETSPVTYGFGMFAVTGFGLNYAGSTTNPLLMPRPPAGLGLGPVMAQYQVLQMAPSIVLHASERLSVSASPLIDIGYLQLDPMLIAAPDDANGDTFFSYPFGTHSLNAWGAGFSIGTHYQGDFWAFGASYKSEQWFTSYKFNTADEVGVPRFGEFDLDMPAIASIGAAFQGIENFLIAADVRYIDFENTDGYDRAGFAPDGSLLGLGFKNIFAVSLGTQLTLSDALSVRGGYSFNENPIPSDQATTNAASPVIIQHMVSCGLSYQVTEDFTLTAAYVHAFKNELSGTIDLPTGTIPGSNITSTAAINMISFGATVGFGPRFQQ